VKDITLGKAQDVGRHRSVIRCLFSQLSILARALIASSRDSIDPKQSFGSTFTRLAYRP
jgi:hypothetical protein